MLGNEEMTQDKEKDNISPKLYILCGIPFSGKSVLAKELAKTKYWERIDLDDVKFELFGNDIKDEELIQDQWDQVYQEMYKKIQTSLEDGQTVIHDTGNFTKHERQLVRDIAEKLDIPSATIWVQTPEEVAFERLRANKESKERFDVSEKSFREAVAEMETPTVEENVIVFDGVSLATDWIAQTFSASSSAQKIHP